MLIKIIISQSSYICNIKLQKEELKMSKNKCKLKIGFLGAITVLALLRFAPRESPVLIIAAVIHELGHVIAARLCGIELKSLHLNFLGATLFLRSSLFSYRQEILLCLGGPAANLISAALILPLRSRSYSANLLFFFSLFLAMLNLLPIKSFDGGRIFFSLLSTVAQPKVADKVLAATSFLFIFLLWCLSAYLLLTTSSSIALFTFCLCLFSKTFISRA